MTNVAEKKLARLFRALGHPVRIQILNLLRDGEECVCHITTVLNLPQPYVSQHLAVLRRAGLVMTRREGQNTYYRLADGRILNLMDNSLPLLRKSEGKPLSFAFSGAIRMPSLCPCPKCQSAGQKTALL